MYFIFLTNQIQEFRFLFIFLSEKSLSGLFVRGLCLKTDMSMVLVSGVQNSSLSFTFKGPTYRRELISL